MTDIVGTHMQAPHRSGNAPAYTIATLVNDAAQYAAMKASFDRFGFAKDCEFLHIDNTGKDQTDAYAGLNQLLNAATGPFVILCHQDVRLIDDGRAKLDVELSALEKLDPNWALAGNAGGVCPGRLAIRITDPHGTNTRMESLPARVGTLDENFIVVKRAARVGFSRNLSGFHFYGADICLAADILGYSAYVIDFHVHHLSPGSIARDFFTVQSKFRDKWSKALRPRWLQTTCALVPVSGNVVGYALRRLATRPLHKFLNWANRA